MRKENIMFREIRRNKKQILSKVECEAILNSQTSGVLCVLGDEDYPYGVPMSYSYTDNKLVFHGMKIGHKMDAIRNHNKVSFTVIETDQVVPEEYTTYFRSVIIFGKANVIEDLDKKREVLNSLVKKYSPDYINDSKEEIESKLGAVCIFEVDIEHMSGKEAIEFAEAR